MKKHFECVSINGRKEKLVFDWDEETGEISGSGYKFFEEQLEEAEIFDGYIGCHPHGMDHKLSDEPFKNKTDMAALIGYFYVLPEELEPYYPRFEVDEEQAERERRGESIVG